MKTGNKIVIAYYGTIAMGILVIMLYMRFGPHKDKEDRLALLNSKTKYVELFSCLSVSNIPRLEIVESDTSKIVVYYSKKDSSSTVENGQPKNEVIIPELYLKVIGDTLVLDSVSGSVKTVKIFCKKGLKQIKANHSKIEYLSMSGDSLQVFLNKAKWNDYIADSAKRSKFSLLKIEATHFSEVIFSKTEIDVLHLLADSSTVEVNSKVNSIVGEIRGDSKLRSNKYEGNITIKKDKSSYIELNNNWN